MRERETRFPSSETCVCVTESYKLGMKRTEASIESNGPECDALRKVHDWVQATSALPDTPTPCGMPPNNTTRQARNVTVEDFTTVALDFFSEKVLALQNVIGVHGADGPYSKDCKYLEEVHHRRISAENREAFFSQEEMETPLASQHVNTLLQITLRTQSSSDTDRKSSVKYLGGGWLEEPSSSLHSPTRSSPHLRELPRPRRTLSPPPPRAPIGKKCHESCATEAGQDGCEGCVTEAGQSSPQIMRTGFEQLGDLFQVGNSQHQEEASECQDKQPRLWLF